MACVKATRGMAFGGVSLCGTTSGGKIKLFEGSAGYGNGEQRRDFVSVEDGEREPVFQNHPEKSGITNLGTGRAQTFNGMAVASVNTARAARWRSCADDGTNALAGHCRVHPPKHSRANTRASPKLTTQLRAAVRRAVSERGRGVGGICLGWRRASSLCVSLVVIPANDVNDHAEPAKQLHPINSFIIQRVR